MLALVLSAPPLQAQEAARGLELMRDSTKGNCSICHVIPGIGLPEDAQGTIGPPLAGVGGRLTRAEIAARITDPRIANPDTIMPAYGVSIGLVDVAAAWRGRPILTGPEIDAISGWLAEQR